MRIHHYNIATVISFLPSILIPPSFALPLNQSPPNDRLCIFGMGTIGTLLARTATNYDTYSISRTPIVPPRTTHIDFSGNWDPLKQCTHILITVPPSADGDPVLDRIGSCVRDYVAPQTWLGYVSTTSVYGDHGGDWVSEDSSTNCLRGSKGEMYLHAERAWTKASEDCCSPLHIFRCGGMYGKDRSAIHTLRERGRGEVKDRPTPRIHEADVVNAILGAMRRREGGVWNLVDDDCASRGEVMEFGVGLMEEAGVKMRSMEGGGRRRRRTEERKKVCNSKMKVLLPGGKLSYPTYREGLVSVLNHNIKTWLD